MHCIDHCSWSWQWHLMNSFQLVFETLCCFFFANHPRLTKTHSFSGVFQNMLTSPKKISILDTLLIFKWHGKQPYPPCCSPPIKHCLSCPLSPNSRFHLRPVKATAPCIRQSRRNLKNALPYSILGISIGIISQCYRWGSQGPPESLEVWEWFFFPAYMGKGSHVLGGPWRNP